MKTNPKAIRDQDVLNVLAYVNELDAVAPKDGSTGLRFQFLWHNIVKWSQQFGRSNKIKDAQMLMLFINDMNTYLSGYLVPGQEEFKKVFFDYRKELKADLQGIIDSAMGASTYMGETPITKEKSNGKR